MRSELLVRQARTDDIPGIARLNARVFGPGRFARTAYRVREAAPRQSQYCHVGFFKTRLVAALNFTEINIGARSGALLLGPFVVEPDVSKKGLGGVLMEIALKSVSDAGVPLVILVGDEPFYRRFGFGNVPIGQIEFPGPLDPARILVLENKIGALENYRGKVTANS